MGRDLGEVVRAPFQGNRAPFCPQGVGPGCYSDRLAYRQELSVCVCVSGSACNWFLRSGRGGHFYLLLNPTDTPHTHSTMERGGERKYTQHDVRHKQ